MALRNIVKLGDPILRKKSREVTKFDDRLFTLLDDMKQTMYKSEGVGLAAVQVGVLKRVVVLDCGDGTWTEAPVQTIAVNGRICDVGVDLKINNRKPRVYNGTVDIGCFQYFCPPGLMLLMK